MWFMYHIRGIFFIFLFVENKGITDIYLTVFYTDCPLCNLFDPFPPVHLNRRHGTFKHLICLEAGKGNRNGEFKNKST